MMLMENLEDFLKILEVPKLRAVGAYNVTPVTKSNKSGFKLRIRN